MMCEEPEQQRQKHLCKEKKGEVAEELSNIVGMARDRLDQKVIPGSGFLLQSPGEFRDQRHRVGPEFVGGDVRS